MDHLSPCNTAPTRTLTTSGSISLVGGSLADFSFSPSTSDPTKPNSVPFPSMPSEKELPTLEFSCSVLSMLEGLVKVKSTERRIGSLNACAKQCLASQAAAPLQFSNSSLSFLEESVKEKAVEPQVFSLMSCVATIPLPVLEEDRASEESTLTASPELDDEAFANFRVPFVVPTSTSEDTFASGTLTASPALDDEAFATFRMPLDDAMPIVTLEPPTPALTASPTSTVLTASPTSTIFAFPSATQSLLLPGSSLSLGDLPLGDVSFISVASIALLVPERNWAPEESTLTASPALDDEAFASFRMDLEDPTPVVTLEPPTPVLTASPTSTIFAFPSATQSLLLPGSSLSLGDLSLPLGDVSFISVAAIALPVPEEKNRASEEGMLTTSPALDDEAFANFRLPLDGPSSTPTVAITVDPPTPVLTLTASPTSTIFAFPSATQSLLLLPLPEPSPSNSLADLSFADVDISFISSLGLISPEAQKEIDEADERLESLLAGTKAEITGCFPPIKALAHDWDLEEGEFALFEYNLVSMACSHPEFGFLCDIIEEHEDNVDIEGEYEQKVSEYEQEKEEEEEKGIVGLAHDWDSEGEFALFEYNLISRECSHPELEMLWYIAEEDEGEYEYESEDEDEEWVKEMAFFEDEDEDEYEYEDEDEEWVKEMAFFEEDEDEDDEWVKEMEGNVSLYDPILEEVDWMMTPTMMQDDDMRSLRRGMEEGKDEGRDGPCMQMGDALPVYAASHMPDGDALTVCAVVSEEEWLWSVLGLWKDEICGSTLPTPSFAPVAIPTSAFIATLAPASTSNFPSPTPSSPPTQIAQIWPPPTDRSYRNSVHQITGNTPLVVLSLFLQHKSIFYKSTRTVSILARKGDTR
ncbi:uncharacterized protein STEHIDRAFT_161006 [Stereum hirsutum FP-91666 SS1]|uniref:uncharacterized protein n=1 Tax=Stereum hirsutum (strain FP-91666) TaxID=721885 RepID=UPI0004449BDB|nr:uncharacterized protein STEHIDRAFT_161006 [Stereum hirsutum FP-91666 SS1]EIM82469.1 hypothetical protein STEHIDRAFT_161006 [Stereum hirsutum FP-91666 SS1]